VREASHGNVCIAVFALPANKSTHPPRPTTRYTTHHTTLHMLQHPPRGRRRRTRRQGMQAAERRGARQSAGRAAVCAAGKQPDGSRLGTSALHSLPCVELVRAADCALPCRCEQQGDGAPLLRRSVALLSAMGLLCQVLMLDHLHPRLSRPLLFAGLRVSKPMTNTPCDTRSCSRSPLSALQNRRGGGVGDFRPVSDQPADYVYLSVSVRHADLHGLGPVQQTGADALRPQTAELVLEISSLWSISL
jgi:hypothetical protein